MAARPPLPARDPHPGRQPDDRGGAHPPRCRDARPAGRRAVGARDRRGPRGDAAVRGRDPRPPRPAPPPAGPRLRPRRHDHPPDRAHRPARRRGHHRGVGRAGRPTSSSSAGAGARPVATTATARPSSRRPSTRSSATPRATSRSSSSAAARTIRRVLVPVRGGPHAELALRFADAIAIHHDATVIVLHLVPPGITLAVRAQAERALAAFIKQHITGRSEAVLREAPNVRNAILREAEKADLVVMGASASPGGADGESYLFGALPEAIAARAKPTVMVVKTRESIERTTFDQLAATRRDAGRRRPRRRGGTRRPGPGRALVRRIELPPRRVRRPAPAGDAQGEAEADDQPRPADPQRGGDDRADRAQGDARDGRSRAAPRRGPRHGLGVDRPDPRDRRGRGRPRRPASRRADPLRLVRRQGRGALEVGLRDRPATSSCGPTRT